MPAFAHSGRTDANGGHWNRSPGEYHYHNLGSSTSTSTSSYSSSSSSTGSHTEELAASTSTQTIDESEISRSDLSTKDEFIRLLELRDKGNEKKINELTAQLNEKNAELERLKCVSLTLEADLAKQESITLLLGVFLFTATICCILLFSRLRKSRNTQIEASKNTEADS